MKTDLFANGSYNSSRAIRPESRSSKIVPGKLLPSNLSDSKNPDYKVELSSNSSSTSPRPSPELSLPSVSLPTPPVPSVPTLPEVPKLETKNDVLNDEIKEKAVKEAKKLADKVADGTVKKPAILFIKGLDLFSSPLKSEGGYAGMGRIAESIEGSRIYGWDQKDEVINEIKKIHKDYPVILVGHSLGGDTAIEIADELDSLDQGFRSVDLLITLDAIGFSHDVIPQNVKKHLNIFGETSIVLKDGPHVARRGEKTQVTNILSPLDHTDIDDDSEVQFEIVQLIQETLAKKQTPNA